MDPDIVKKIRCSVCAVGYLKVPMEQHKIDASNPDFFIVGTGFLVADNLIMTNKHVLEDVYKLEDQKGVPKEQFLVSFVYPQKNKEPNWQLCYTGITKSFIPNEADRPDIGFIEFSRDKTTNDFNQCKPVIFDDLQNINIGDPVAMWGYPTGTALLQPSLGYNQNQKLCRIGPVLQQGYISAGTPFEVEQGTLEFLLDIRTYNGMSGSPVFNPTTGKVIGIHYKSNKLTTSVAVAFSDKDIAFWLSQLGKYNI